MTLMFETDGAPAAETFDRNEVSGMQSAGFLLLAMAGLVFVGWLFGHAALPMAVVIDIFLGLQLLRRRHSWRSWALLRGWLGLPIGLLIAIDGAGPSGLLIGIGHIVYSGSLLLLLFGQPSAKRVRAGRVAAFVSFASFAIVLL